MAAQGSVMMFRGAIYRFDMGYGDKPWLVVSNNARNRNLGSVLVVRITTSQKPDLPSIVRIPPGNPVVGSVLCDDIDILYEDDGADYLGALSPEVMSEVDAGLKAALGLT